MPVVSRPSPDGFCVRAPGAVCPIMDETSPPSLFLPRLGVGGLFAADF